jgi:quercetin dioxygenase-like cupin family protein
MYTTVHSNAAKEVTAMSALAIAAPPVKVVQPGEGSTGGLAPGIGVQFKLDGADSLGSLAIVEHPFAVGALVPPHIHTREDEYSIVTEGRIGFRSNDQEVVLEAGGYIVKPRGEVHAMWNAGKHPARMIEIIAPAGFEGFFREMAAMTATGVFDWDVLGRLSDKYGLPFTNPDWLPGVIERYGLTPPPAPPSMG